MQNFRRTFLVVLFANVPLLLAPQAILAGAKPVLTLPKVKSRASVMPRRSGPALLVHSLSVRHDPEIKVRVSCGGCSRLRTPLPRQTNPNRNLTRFLGLEWILAPGHHAQVLVLQQGAIGRYLLLAVKRPIGPHSLKVVGAGCLNGQRQRMTCPAGENPTLEPPPLEPTPEENGIPETAGGETHTHSDYKSASGSEGPVIGSGQTVQISCRVEGLPVEDKNPWWYRIASSPWSNRYYASADAFYNNGQTSGSLRETPFYDSRVPLC
jgi:hypothetical protein